MVSVWFLGRGATLFAPLVVMAALLFVWHAASQASEVPLLRFSASSGVAADASGHVISWTSIGQSTAITTKLPSSHVVRVGGVLNGNPVIRFDGFPGEVLQGTAAVPMSPPLILAVVANAGGPASGCCNNVFSLGPAGSYGISYSGVVGADGSGNLCMTTDSIIGQTPLLIRLRYGANLSLVNASLVLNGTSVPIPCSGFSPLSPPNGTLQIGGRTFGGLPARVFTGDIAEIVYFVNASAVSNTSVNVVESMLALTYGVPRPGNSVSSSGQEVFSNTAPFRQCVVALGLDTPIQFDQRVAGAALLASSSPPLVACPLLGLSTSANLTAPNPGARPLMPDGGYFVCGSNASGGGVFAAAPWLNQAVMSAPRSNRVVRLHPPQSFSVVWRCEANNRSLPSTVHVGFVVPPALMGVVVRGSLALVVDTDGSSDGQFANLSIVPLFRAGSGSLWTTRGPLESVPQGTMFWTFAIVPRSLSMSVSSTNLAPSTSWTQSSADTHTHSSTRASHSHSGEWHSLTLSNSSGVVLTWSFATLSATASHSGRTRTDAQNRLSYSASVTLGSPTRTHSKPRGEVSHTESVTFEAVPCNWSVSSVRSSSRRGGTSMTVENNTEISISSPSMPFIIIVIEKSLFVSTTVPGAAVGSGSTGATSAAVMGNATVNISLSLSKPSGDRCFLRLPRGATGWSRKTSVPEGWHSTECFWWNTSLVDGVAVDSWVDEDTLTLVVLFRVVADRNTTIDNSGDAFRLASSTTLLGMFNDSCLAAFNAHDLCSVVAPNFTFVLRAVPVASTPPPSALPDATVTSKTVTAVVAAVTDPLVAMQANRASLAVLLLVCAPPSGPVPLFMSPLPIALGTSDMNFTAGAVIGNHVIILMFLVLQGLVAAQYFLRSRPSHPLTTATNDDRAPKGDDNNEDGDDDAQRRKEQRFRMLRAMAVARFPSFTVYPVLFLQQSTVSVAVASLVYGGDDVGVRAVGAIGLLLAFGPVAVAYRILRAPGGLPCAYHPDAQRSVHGRTPLSIFFFGNGKWIDTDVGLPGATKFKQRCQFLFADYTDRCPYFMLAEMSLNVVCGVIQGLIFPGQCKSLLFANGAVVAVYVTAAVYLRPFVSWFQLCYCVVNCLMQLVSIGLSLAAVQFSVADAFDVAVQFNQATVYFTLVQALVGLWPRARRVSLWVARLRRLFGREETKAPFLSESLLHQHDGLDIPLRPLSLALQGAGDDDEAVSLRSVATQPVTTSARFDDLSDEALLQQIEALIAEARVDAEEVRDAAATSVRELRLVTIPGAALRPEVYRLERAVAIERCVPFAAAVRELLQRLSVASVSRATTCEKAPEAAPTDAPSVAAVPNRLLPSNRSTVQLLRDLSMHVDEVSSSNTAPQSSLCNTGELRAALTSLLAAWGGQEESEEETKEPRGIVLDSEVDVVRRDAGLPCGFFDEGSEAAAVASELIHRLEDALNQQRLARGIFDLGAGTELAEESLLMQLASTRATRMPSVLSAPPRTSRGGDDGDGDGTLEVPLEEKDNEYQEDTRDAATEVEL